MKRNVLHSIFIIAILSITGAGCAGSGSLEQSEKENRRADVRKQANQTLTELYRIQPQAKRRIDTSAGYAVFSNFGIKIFVAGGGTGKGMAVNSRTAQENFMEMVEIQAGLGLGIKKFRVVWVFEKESQLNNFINSGWEFGGQSTAALKIGDKGSSWAGAMSVAPGVWLYQLTDEGLALELTAKGTKYYMDKELN